jgi:hypothetical protein
MTSAPSPLSVKNKLKFSNPEQPWREALDIVSGSPAEPMGSWSSQGERSKFPPGAQSGLSWAVTDQVASRRSGVSLIRAVDLVKEKEGIFEDALEE